MLLAGPASKVLGGNMETVSPGSAEGSAASGGWQGESWALSSPSAAPEENPASMRSALVQWNGIYATKGARRPDSIGACPLADKPDAPWEHVVQGATPNQTTIHFQPESTRARRSRSIGLAVLLVGAAVTVGWLCFLAYSLALLVGGLVGAI
jgi:hypothetical protein